MEYVPEPLMQKFAVDNAQIIEAFHENLFPQLQLLKPMESPTCVIVGAQPGAGKTSVLEFVQREYNDNIMLCNADEYRKFHPKAYEMLKHYEDYYPALTADFAQKLNVMLRNECRNRRLNFVLETTFSDGRMINQTINKNRELGYKSNIDIIALNERWSRLGTKERFENSKANTKTGRVVDTEAHDSRYHKMPGAIADVIDEGQYNIMRIFARQCFLNEDGSIDQKVVLHSVHPNNPLSVFVKERERVMNPLEKKYYQEKIQNVYTLMKGRGADSADIIDFLKQFGAHLDYTKRRRST